MLLRILQPQKAGTHAPKQIIVPALLPFAQTRYVYPSFFSLLAHPGFFDNAPEASARKRCAPASGSPYRPKNALSIAFLRYFASALSSAKGPASSGAVSHGGDEARACGGPQNKELTRFWKSLGILRPDKLDCWSISRQVGVSKLRDLVEALQWGGLSNRSIARLLGSHPNLLHCKPADIIRNVRALKGLGLEQKELKKHVLGVPALLSANWVNNSHGIMKLGVEKEVMRRWFTYDPQFFLRAKISTVQRQLGILSELGISTEQAGKIISREEWFLRMNSKDFSLNQFNLLRSLGFKDTDIGKLITQHKAFFGYTVERDLQPAVKCLEGLGLKKEEITKVFLANPQTLKTLCTNETKDKITLLESYGVDKEDIGRLILLNPVILQYSLQGKIRPTLEHLKHEGLQGKEISQVLLGGPRLLGGFMLERFHENVRVIAKFGFKENSSKFYKVLKYTLALNVDEVEARIQNLLNLGFSHQDVGKMVTTLPSILGRPQDKIVQVVDYLVNHTSYSISDIVKVPMYLCYHLEKRIKPRLQMLHWLWAEGLKKEGTPLASVMLTPNQKFFEKFVVCYPEGPAIFQKFAESSVDMHIKQQIPNIGEKGKSSKHLMDSIGSQP